MKVLLLSPHFDDAPLSLGQAMLDGELAGHQTSVGILFSRTNWSQWWYPNPRRWPLISAIRRGEEAVTSFRFKYKVRGAGLQEYILRTGVGDPDSYRSPIAAFERNEIRNVVEAVEAVATRWARDVDVVLAPLGVGDHHDHQIVAEAARRLGERGHTVAYYEDRPYTTWLGAEAAAEVARRVDPTLERRAASGPITADKHRRLFYPSQLSAEFQEAIAADEAGDAREFVWVSPDAAWPPKT
ncbi:MAG: hypothetical protein GX868_11135 [Actinobacteria bacterium]|nr:hypothetical protein [Actinomycetota bacterium]